MKMTRMDYDLKNIELSGKNWHYSKLAEECAELGAAILQYLNKGGELDNIEKEIADVEIAIDYYRIIHKDTERFYNIDRYKKLKYAKIDRAVRRMMKKNEKRKII